MARLLPVGSELWFLFFNRDLDNYEPRCFGTIEETSTRYGYRIGRKWHEAAYPHFGTEAEARAYIREHPHSVPTIKP